MKAETYTADDYFIKPCFYKNLSKYFLDWFLDKFKCNNAENFQTWLYVIVELNVI